MPSSIPQEFQDEGRQLARILLDALSKAVHDLAAVNVAKLSSAERRRWAVQSIRMARMLATAFPQAIADPHDSDPKPPRRKVPRKHSTSKRTQLLDETASKKGCSEPPKTLPLSGGAGERSEPVGGAHQIPNGDRPSTLDSPSPRPANLRKRPSSRPSLNTPSRFIFRSMEELLPARAAALADRILGPPDPGEPGA